MRRRRAAIWLAVAGFGSGTVAAEGGGPPRPWVLLVIVAASGLLVVRRRTVVGLIGVAGIAAACGSFGASSSGPGLGALAGSAPECMITGTVAEFVRPPGTILRVEGASCDGPHRRGDLGNVVIEGTRGIPGGSYRATGRLLPLGNDGFDVVRRRAGADASFVVDELEAGAPALGAPAVAETFRRAIREATAPLPRDRRGLLRGITIGDTGELDERTLEDFRRTGLSHLLAVSGSNVAIVLGAAVWLCRNLSLYARVGCAATALGVFILVVGPDPSVLRAGAMGAIVLLGIIAGERVDPLDALGVALLTVLSFRPALVFSVGLQLSAAATAGIVLWSGPMERALRLPRPVGLPLAVTVAAQVAVAPILALTFGEVSVIAPLTNLLSVPAIAPATVAGLGAGLCHIVSPSLARLVAGAVEPLAAWVLAVGRQGSGPGWAVAETSEPAGVVLAVLVGGLALRSMFVARVPLRRP